MKVLVCGGRDYDNKEQLERILSAYFITALVSGKCSGADQMALDWAKLHVPSAKIYEHPADWGTYGKSAGPIRNRTMLEMHRDIDLVLAFPGGKGTADMVRQARTRRVPVREVGVGE